METLPKLTLTQALLLRAAARRADGRVIPPANLRGGARVKVLTALMQRGWIEPADDGHALDLEHDLAVVEQQHVARPHVLRQLLVVEAGTRLVAELALGIQDEPVARVQGDAPVLEFADADLRPLQVGHDADGAPGLAAQVPDELGARTVVVGGPVREVHPHDVDAGADHAFEHHGVARCGPERGDDLGAAPAFVRRGLVGQHAAPGRSCSWRHVTTVGREAASRL